MAGFTYRVIDARGNIQSGKIEADDISSAAFQLRNQGYYVVHLSPEKKSKNINLSFNFSLKRNVNEHDLALFCRLLSTMLSAGVPLLRGLLLLQKQVKNEKLKTAIGEVADNLREGDSFAESMKKNPGIFRPLMISMIEAGEFGGALDEVLMRLAGHYEREFEIKEKVRGALAYPIMVLIVAVIVVVIMLTFVLPNFSTLFSEMGVKLPLPTKIVLKTSQIFVSYWHLILVSVTAFILFLYKFFKKEQGKLLWDKYILKVPIFGDLLNKLVIARFSKTLGTMLQGGVPILDAVEIAKNTTHNEIVKNAIQELQDGIGEGSSMAEPLERSGIFPEMVTQMISVGEESGSLTELLEKIGNFYEEEVDTKIQKLSKLIEPILLLVLGSIVAFVVISVIMPLFKLMGAI